MTPDEGQQFAQAWLSDYGLQCQKHTSGHMSPAMIQTSLIRIFTGCILDYQRCKFSSYRQQRLLATDKRGIHIFFLFLDENIRCGYSLEAPWRGASNEYPQHMFPSRNKKDISIFRMKKVPYLLLWDSDPAVWMSRLISVFFGVHV